MNAPSSIRQRFEEALAVPLDHREAWLSAQIDDPAMRERLRCMLSASGTGTSWGSDVSRVLAAAFDASAVVGERLGPYLLIEEIGGGGNGVVFLAERADRQFEQRVAIKVLRSLDGPVEARRLRDERQILANLNHPAIARLLDGGETDDGRPYLVMEFIAGEPVTQACAQRNLGVRSRVELVRELAHALHYAHRHLVIHRDIKPANVLLREDGRPVLLDFGIAKLLDPESMTVSTQPWFTPAYASPEQRAGKPLSTASDVYSLGLLLSELIASVEPARGDLARIVRRATADEPDCRYASAEAFAEDLQRYLSGRPLQASDGRWWYRVRKLAVRHPYASAAVLLSTVVGIGFLIALENERAKARHEAETAVAVTRYIVDLFRVADPRMGSGRQITPLTLIELGEERLEEQANLPDAHRARLFAAFGEIYLNLGATGKAQHVLTRALQYSHGIPARDQAEILESLALAAESRQQFGQQRDFYLQALDRIPDEKSSLTGRLLAGLALAHCRLGAHAQAEGAIRQAIETHVAVNGAQSPSALEAKVYLGEILGKAGQLDKADALMRRSIAALREQLPGDDLRLAAALGFHGVLLADRRDFEQAEAVFNEALAIRRAKAGPDGQQIALIQSHLGRINHEQGRPLQAIAHLQAALDINADAGNSGTLSDAVSRMNLGAMYEEVGDYAEAIALFRRALEIARAQGRSGLIEAVAHQSLGRALMLSGDAEESRAQLEVPIGAIDAPDWALQRGRQRVHLAEWHRRFGTLADALRYVEEAESNLQDIGGAAHPRTAAVLRLRGLIALQERRVPDAKRHLKQARALLVAARNKRYIGVGELDLDLAELALAAGDLAAARRQLAQARDILADQLHAAAPMRERIARLAARLAG